MSNSIYAELFQRFQYLLDSYQRRQITQQQFYSEVGKLQARDEAGRWWTIDPRDGSFLCYEQNQWRSAMPPGYATSQKSLARELKSPSKKLLGILGLATPLVTAACWLIYSWLALDEQHDCLTPLIIAGLPLLFVYFRRPIDALLLPIQPVRRLVPKFLLYGVSLAFPLVVGYILAAMTYSGYGVPRLVSLLSLVGGYVLVRDPEVKK